MSLILAINPATWLPFIGPQDDFETFSDSFEMIPETLAQKRSFLTAIIGDFNAKSSNWYIHEGSTEGSDLILEFNHV